MTAVLTIVSVSSLVFPAKAHASGSFLKSIGAFVTEQLRITPKTNVQEKIESQKNIAENDRTSDSTTKDEKKKDKNKNQPDEDGVSKEELEKEVEFASAATGVRKDFLMGTLVVESELGNNTGQCTYEEVENGAIQAHQNGQLSWKAWNTFNQRKKTIKNLAHKLDYDYKTLKVSCNPSRYAGTGGALGIGQFMPDTWLEYEQRVGKIVGKKNPDPWSIRDGVVAMALKLSDVPGTTQHNVWAERNASKLYLSGTTSMAYDWYADQIQYWSKNYDKLSA